MIVINWMGYYSNRQRYPVWHGEFFNIPLLQYLISFVILFLYWRLGITALPQNSPTSKAGPPVLPTPFDEMVIIFAVFVRYLVWDTLEILVQETIGTRTPCGLLIGAGSCPLSERPTGDDFVAVTSADVPISQRTYAPVAL